MHEFAKDDIPDIVNHKAKRDDKAADEIYYLVEEFESMVFIPMRDMLKS